MNVLARSTRQAYDISSISSGVGNGRGIAAGERAMGDIGPGDTGPGLEEWRWKGFRVCMREMGEERTFEVNQRTGRELTSKSSASVSGVWALRLG